MNKIIKNSKTGFFQINPDANECYNGNELRKIFSEFKNPKFLLDAPMHKRYPNNFIFAYGL